MFVHDAYICMSFFFFFFLHVCLDAGASTFSRTGAKSKPAFKVLDHSAGLQGPTMEAHLHPIREAG